MTDSTSPTVGYGVFEESETGNLLVGCWTEQDNRENAIEGSNFYPTEAAASVGVIDALNKALAVERAALALACDLLHAPDRERNLAPTREACADVLRARAEAGEKPKG